MYSYKIEQAIKAASVLHQGQLRMGLVPLPYISHFMAVVMILNDYTDDEDTLVAGFLHDTLEDTEYTLEELKEDFGESVADIVLAVTEPKFKGDVKLTWAQRKDAYVKQLKSASPAGLMVSAADKVHNFRSIVEEYLDDPERYVRDFKPRYGERLEAYQSIANVINSRLKSDLLHEFNHTFNEFKQFLINVEKTQQKN